MNTSQQLQKKLDPNPDSWVAVFCFVLSNLYADHKRERSATPSLAFTFPRGGLQYYVRIKVIHLCQYLSFVFAYGKCLYCICVVGYFI